VACCALSQAPAWADDYPSRPVRVIVPFSPGGAVDGPMRLVAQELGKQLGQSVVVENRPGAGATIGSDAVAKAPADGYTLLLASQTNAIAATLYPKLPFDPIEDFAPITLIGREPGVVDYASSGNGSGQHLFAAMLCSMTGMKMNHVPIAAAGKQPPIFSAARCRCRSRAWQGCSDHQVGQAARIGVTGAARAQPPAVPTVTRPAWRIRSVRVDGAAPPKARLCCVTNCSAKWRSRRIRRGSTIHGERWHRGRRSTAGEFYLLPQGEGHVRKSCAKPAPK
jgi:tripartite-type tricarboxylate transporter receptor subunit TctC